MRFIDREKEFATLKKILEKSRKFSQMTIVSGRRRIGKTRLLLEFFKDKKFLYFFISRKSEPLLCEEFTEEIKTRLNKEIIGKINSFSDIFKFLIDYSKTKHLNLIIDEVQEFYKINKSVYYDIQKLWDMNKEEAKINLIFSGSVYSIMKKIFEDSKEPLFNRANNRINLTPLSPSTLKSILKEKKYLTEDNLLNFYTITGGMPKYIEIFYEEEAFELNKMLDIIFYENSIFIDEGKNILIEEFGKDYYNYFSILSLIASSKTSRSEIESILEINVSGFLERLEKDYGIIKRVKPVLAKPGSKKQKYEIIDNFLNFWFRFIYKNQTIIQADNFDYLKELVKRDFDTYRGIFLEKLFIEYLKGTGKYTQIGKYWERGHKNEIDIVAINEREKEVELFDVKLKEKKLNINELKKRSTKLIKKSPGYKIKYRGLSLKDLNLI